MSDTTTTEPDTNTDEMKGKFFENLKRSNRQIKSDRALSIAEDAEMAYKRKVEDLEREVKRVNRDRANMLDLNAKDANSLIVASDFSADQFVTKDIELGLKLRNLEIQLEVAKASYKNLFE
jgi:hypothetical protein